MVEEVGERPSTHHILRRKDQSKPIGPGNWRWVETISQPDHAARMREYRKRNPETFQRIQLKQRWGLTLEDYNEMLERQDGVCAICKRPERMLNNRSKMVQGLSIDHCHSEGHIRGLLCSDCNTTLGKVNDDVTILKAMIDYLEANRK
jgi:DNA-binding transcriptional MerR regulator